jgi:SAM-dependent methyltransferase
MSSAHTHSVYDSFAWFFNRYWGDSFSKDARPVIEQCLLPHLPVGGRILDLCCGTGQLSHWLTVCGFHVAGLDISAGMIRFARENAPAAHFMVADARAFTTPPVHAAVVSTFDSLNHIPSQQELQSVFQNVHDCLAPDGLFLFDMNMDQGFRASAPETYAVVKQDHVCIMESVYHPSRGLGSSDVTLFRRVNGAWQRADLRILEYLHPEEQVRASLAAAGFEQVLAYDAERDLGMARGEGRLFFLASKGRMPPDMRP